MSIISGLIGNATEINVSEAQTQVTPILIETERVERAFRLIRDLFVFTNWRLILIDYRGMTGKKVDYHSIPYKHITHFSIETAGHIDLDSQLKLWIVSMPDPVTYDFKRSSNIIAIQQTIAYYVLRSLHS